MMPKFKYDFDDTIHHLFTFKSPHISLSRGLSIVLPLRGRSDLCIRCIQYLKYQNISPLEIIVVEEDVAPQNIVWPHDIKHIFINSISGFNKCRAVNIGVMSAKYDFVVMSDIDMILQDGYLASIYGVLLNHEAGSLAGEIFYLTDNKEKFTFSGRRWTNNKTINFWPYGGNIFFTKLAFKSIGGMCEEFVGHGYEDGDFYERISSLSTFVSNRSLVMLHMQHPGADVGFREANGVLWHKLNLTKMEDRIKQCREQFVNKYGN